MKLESKTIGSQIIEAFANGDIPKALAPVFLKKINIPSHGWSWSNKLIVAVNGHADARTFKQWKKVGRYVRKGQKCFKIYAPVFESFSKLADPMKSINQDDTLLGYRTVPVFGLSQTEGKPLENHDEENQNTLDSLPLIEVAKSWGIKVAIQDGRTRDIGRKWWTLHGLWV